MQNEIIVRPRNGNLSNLQDNIEAVKEMENLREEKRELDQQVVNLQHQNDKLETRYVLI